MTHAKHDTVVFLAPTKEQFREDLTDIFKRPCTDLGVSHDQECFAANETAGALAEDVCTERATVETAISVAANDGLFFAADCFACHTKTRPTDVREHANI